MKTVKRDIRQSSDGGSPSSQQIKNRKDDLDYALSRIRENAIQNNLSGKLLERVYESGLHAFAAVQRQIVDNAITQALEIGPPIVDAAAPLEPISIAKVGA